MALQVRLMSIDVTRRQLHSSTPVQGVLSVMGMFRQQWCKLETHKFSSWNQRFWVDV